jgi:hypothetical protein
MSWDVSLLKFSKTYTAASDIPEGEEPQRLGTLREVQAAISSVFQGTDWSDPIWGIFGSDLGSIEFNLGKDDPVQSVCLHVRAQDPIVNDILELCARNGWQALDFSDGRFLTPSPTQAQNLRGWRTYLAQVLRRDDA